MNNTPNFVIIFCSSYTTSPNGDRANITASSTVAKKNQGLGSHRSEYDALLKL